MESKKHKKFAERLARLKNTEYHGDKGIDIRTAEQAIEVEVKAEALGQAKKQLAGSSKTPYIAVPPEIRNVAVEATEGTRFGVMGPTGKIYKRGRRKQS